MRGWFKRLRADEHEDRTASITRWAKALDGVTLLRDAEDRAVVKVAGIVSKVKVQPRDGSASYEATVTDGTGEVRAVWLGRKTLPGLTLGCRLIVEGRLGRDAKGRLQLVNPVYEFEAVGH